MQAWSAISDDVAFGLAGRSEIPAEHQPWTSDDPWQSYLVGDPWEGCEDIERESQEEWCADFLQLLTVKDSAKEAEAPLQVLFARCLATGAEEDEPLHACMSPQSIASLSTTNSPSSSSTSVQPSMASGSSARTSTLSFASTDVGVGAPSLRSRWGNDMLGGQDHEADDALAFDEQHASWASPPCAPLPSKCSLGDSTFPGHSTPCRRGAAMSVSRWALAAHTAPTYVQQSPPSCSLRPTTVTDVTCPVMLPQAPRRIVGASKEDVTQANPGTPRGLRPLDGEANQMSREAQPFLVGGNQPSFLGGNCAVDAATFSLQASPVKNAAAPLLGGSLTRMGAQHRLSTSQTFQTFHPTHPQWTTADDAECLKDIVHRIVERPILL